MGELGERYTETLRTIFTAFCKSEEIHELCISRVAQDPKILMSHCPRLPAVFLNHYGLSALPPSYVTHTLPQNTKSKLALNLGSHLSETSVRPEVESHKFWSHALVTCWKNEDQNKQKDCLEWLAERSGRSKTGHGGSPVMGARTKSRL